MSGLLTRLLKTSKTFDSVRGEPVEPFCLQGQRPSALRHAQASGRTTYSFAGLITTRYWSNAAKRAFAIIFVLSLISGAVFAGAVTYQYDQAGRLRTTTYSDASTRTYTLDAAGNRTALTVAVTNDSIAPSIPTGLTATRVSATQVNLSWAASTDTGGSGLAGYKIYRAGTQIATTTSTTYSDTNAPSNLAYTIVAYDNSGNASVQSTSATPVDNIAPSIPTGLTASRVSSTQVNLTWTASTDTGGSGLAGYRVYGAGALLGTTATASYSDSNASAGKSYTVTAYDNAGNVSAQSSAVVGPSQIVEPIILQVGVANEPFGVCVGFRQNVIGAITPNALSGSRSVYAIDTCSGVNNTHVVISGFTSDPGKGWLFSVSSNGNTLYGSAATSYGYSSGMASWMWPSFNTLGFTNGGTSAVSISHLP